MIPNFSTAILGQPKHGKTHLAFTWPAPILVFSFDFGSNRVKGKFPDKDITIQTYDIPILDTLDLSKADNEFIKLEKQIRKDIYESLGMNYKTIVFDTGTALWDIERIAYTKERERKQLIDRDYGEINARMYSFIAQVVVAGINFVTIHHLKAEYVDEKATGNMILDGFKRTEGLVDVVLSVERRQSKKQGKIENKIVTTIKDCGFDYELCGVEIENASYDDIVMLLGLA